MKICFTGDVFLGGDLADQSCEGVVKVDSFQSADVRIINLEQAVSDESYIEDKCTLYTSSSALRQLGDLQVDAVNLAHNHIQDNGLDGIAETIAHLKSAKIGSFGAGKNLSEASTPYWLNDNLVLLSYCDF